MNEKQVGYFINHFVHLNPKKIKDQTLISIIKIHFLLFKVVLKKIKNAIITSHYDGIFYNKHSELLGKKWIEILLSSKDIFEYHKLIRDEFPYCQRKKFTKILIYDFDYWFDKNTQNSIIEVNRLLAKPVY